MPKTNRPATRPIFILGTDRSGTSLLGEILYRWGAYPGERDLLSEADPGNPQGYWEYEPMKDFLDKLLNDVEVSLWDPRHGALQRQRAADPLWRDEALALAARMEHGGRPWFWKEPRNTFALAFWREIFDDAVYLITVRSPPDSARSFEKFTLPEILYGKIKLKAYFFLYWQHTMTTVLSHLKDHRRKLFVSYENLLQAPLVECRRIEQFLTGEYAGLANREGRGDTDLAETMAGTIDAGLWRNKNPRPFSEEELASDVQKDLYGYLMDHLDGETGDFSTDRFPPLDQGSEYLTNIEVLRWLLKNL